MRLPAGACARISVAAPRGTANLRVLDRTALGISDRNALLARSRAPGSVAVANPSRDARIVFVAVVRAPRAESRAITYRLRVSRQRSA